MNKNDKSAMRRRLTAGGMHYCPSIYDGISARIAASLGFRFGILGGSVASMRVAGAPDINVLNAVELAEQTRRLCMACDLPLIVDADDGYGNALNVMRTVRELEAAGASAVSIEDTRLPKPFGGGELLISLDEAKRKIEAALAVRTNDDLLIIARTHAAGEATANLFRRISAYTSVGADMICVTGVQSLDRVREIVSCTHLPLFLITYSSAPFASPAELETAGVRIWLDGHAPYLAAVRATYETLTAQAAGDYARAASLSVSADILRQFCDRPAIDAATRSFLKV
jgi:carboxyvinyl-carboxyphosphonate phosphorylmutase